MDFKTFSCPKCHLAFNRKDGMLLHMKVHAGSEMKSQDEVFNTTMFPLPRTMNEYDIPMNLVVTEQSHAVPQRILSTWQSLDHHDAYSRSQ